VNGSTVTSSAFSVDTQKPTQMGNLSISVAPTTSTVTLLLPSTTSTDSNFLDYRIYYDTNSSVTADDNSFTSSTDSDLGNSNFNGTTTTVISGLSPNTTYYFKIFAYDSWGYSTSSVSEVSTTTPASTPTSVVATTNSTSQITLSWSGDGTEIMLKILQQAPPQAGQPAPLTPSRL
jgi:hypothetical protein